MSKLIKSSKKYSDPNSKNSMKKISMTSHNLSSKKTNLNKKITSMLNKMEKKSNSILTSILSNLINYSKSQWNFSSSFMLMEKSKVEKWNSKTQKMSKLYNLKPPTSSDNLPNNNSSGLINLKEESSLYQLH